MMAVSQKSEGRGKPTRHLRQFCRRHAVLFVLSVLVAVLTGCTFDRSRLDQLQPTSDDSNAGNTSDEASAYDLDLRSADAETSQTEVVDNPDCPFLNDCGGCEPLLETIGNSCGECGGTWACDGPNATFCDGSTPNECGECDGPLGALGEPCLCTAELVEDHRWACDGIYLVCTDGNDAREQATVLADSVDSMDDDVLVEGSLAGTDGEDWMVVFVRDSDDYNGLFPDLSLYDLSSDHDFCAYWEYTDGSTADIWCDSGYEHTTDDGLTGCCSASAGLEDEQVRLRNAIWWTNRLDIDSGADNDSGWLYIHIVGIPTETCESYTLQYRF